jgi:hypothetical protein
MVMPLPLAETTPFPRGGLGWFEPFRLVELVCGLEPLTPLPPELATAMVGRQSGAQAAKTASTATA